MSNLASRAHEWTDWKIEEILLEVPLSPKSRAKRKAHFRIVLNVHWHQLGIHRYILTLASSPTRILVERTLKKRQILASAIIISHRHKSSSGSYVAKDPAALVDFLTAQT